MTVFKESSERCFLFSHFSCKGRPNYAIMAENDDEQRKVR